MQSNNNESNTPAINPPQQQQQQQQGQVQQSQNPSNYYNPQQMSGLPYGGVIGFLPIVFFPNCGHNPNSQSPNTANQNIQLPFSSTSSFQVPYPCSQCNNNQLQQQPNQRSLDNDAGNNFQQVLAQAGIDPFSSALIRSPHRRSRTRRVKTNSNATPTTAQNEE